MYKVQQAIFNKVARESKLLWGSLTASQRKLPDFLIIGAQKAGTTSAFHYLSQHPRLKLPEVKEIHYYDNNFHRGSNWYRKHFPTGNDFLTGEATPYYLFHPLVPQRVYQENPKVKLVIFLRSPIYRAFSHFQMMRRLGIEPIPDFQEALRAEPKRYLRGLRALHKRPLEGSYDHQHYTYLSRGKYATQLKRWFQYFPEDQFLILSSEDFFQNPLLVLNSIYRFLGVEPITPMDLTPQNQGEERLPHLDNYHDLAHLFYRHNRELELLLNRKFDW